MKIDSEHIKTLEKIRNNLRDIKSGIDAPTREILQKHASYLDYIIQDVVRGGK